MTNTPIDLETFPALVDKIDDVNNASAAGQSNATKKLLQRSDFALGVKALLAKRPHGRTRRAVERLKAGRSAPARAQTCCTNSDLPIQVEKVSRISVVSKL